MKCENDYDSTLHSSTPREVYFTLLEVFVTQMRIGSKFVRRMERVSRMKGIEWVGGLM
jgi:hypothetical protein